MSLTLTNCPQCGSSLDLGYGLAYGGIGPYVVCLDEKGIDCNWFYKERETLEGHCEEGMTS